jgi:hypothetical protein
MKQFNNQADTAINFLVREYNEPLTIRKSTIYTRVTIDGKSRLLSNADVRSFMESITEV